VLKGCLAAKNRFKSKMGKSKFSMSIPKMAAVSREELMTAKLTEGSSNRSEDSKAGSTTTSRKVRLLVSVLFSKCSLVSSNVFPRLSCTNLQYSWYSIQDIDAPLYLHYVQKYIQDFTL
jgi:hypothetical protein